MRQSITQDRDGFHILVEEFALPTDPWRLDPQTKRAVTICNLFANHEYGISDIAGALGESRKNVIRVLLKQGIIRDRRVREITSGPGIERRTFLVGSNVACVMN